MCRVKLHYRIDVSVGGKQAEEEGEGFLVLGKGGDFHSVILPCPTCFDEVPYLLFLAFS